MAPIARSIAVVLAVLALLAGAVFVRGRAAAADAATPAALADGGTARVSAVIDGDTVRLDDGARSGWSASRRRSCRSAARATRPGRWPTRRSRALEEIVAGRQVGLGFGSSPSTGMAACWRTLARDGLWVQGEMLQPGSPASIPSPITASAAELLALEGQARAARLGIWADPFYAVLAPEAVDARADAGSFEIAEGRVRDAAAVAGRAYLNFGADYRSDFTAVSGPRPSPCSARRIDPTAMKDRRRAGARLGGVIRRPDDRDHPSRADRGEPVTIARAAGACG